jgi:hypothetical protein
MNGRRAGEDRAIRRKAIRRTKSAEAFPRRPVAPARSDHSGDTSLRYVPANPEKSPQKTLRLPPWTGPLGVIVPAAEDAWYLPPK